MSQLHATALAQDVDQIHVFYQELAHPEGESSKLSINSEDLFNTLKQWNKLLSAIQRPANDPEEDICGVAP